MYRASPGVSGVRPPGQEGNAWAHPLSSPLRASQLPLREKGGVLWRVPLGVLGRESDQRDGVGGAGRGRWRKGFGPSAMRSKSGRAPWEKVEGEITSVERESGPGGSDGG